MIRTRSAETGVVRADDLDSAPEGDGYVRRVLHYYVPCVVRGRMVAVIGLGDLEMGRLISPSLSTIGVHGRKIGYTAATLTLERDGERCVDVGFELLLRESG